MIRILALPLVLVTALMLAACGSTDAGTGASPAPSSKEPASSGLAGTSWILTEYAGNGTSGPTAVPSGVEATAAFTAKTISGSTGCNSYTGPYTLKGSDLDIGPVASTLIGCDGDRAVVEAAYLKLLESVAGFAIDGDTLNLTGPGDRVILTFAKATPTALTGTTWTATTINNGKGGAESVVADSTVTAVFGDDKTVSGNGGCNTYNGPYTLEGSTLTFGALAATKKDCELSLTTQESAYLAALSRVATYSIRGEVLELRDNKGALQAAYSAKK